MIDIPMRSAGSVDRRSILNINKTTQNIKSAQNISSLNTSKHNFPKQQTSSPVSQASMPFPRDASPAPRSSAPASRVSAPPPMTAAAAAVSSSAVHAITIPRLVNQIQKGQKVPLSSSSAARHIKVCLGWNVKNPKCDIDVSAFILGQDGKVLGDDWFVFYGQKSSPDQSVLFAMADQTDREFISIDLTRLNPGAKKIVFVLTINDAFIHHLNFSMVEDAYIRILNMDNGQELVSFKMTDYYSNVNSMMIGEIYMHNGIWKCNAIGNGVAKDLAGLCALYGVQVTN